MQNLLHKHRRANTLGRVDPHHQSRVRLKTSGQVHEIAVLSEHVRNLVAHVSFVS